MTDEVTSIIEAVATNLSANEAPGPTETPASSPPPSEAATGPSSSASPGAAPPLESRSADAPDAAAPKPAGVKSPSAAEQAAKEEESELQAIEQELIAKDERLPGRGISASRHQAVLTRTRRQHEAALAEAQKKYAQYEAPEFVDRIKAFQIAEHNPDQFIQILNAIPEYRNRFDALIAQAVEARVQATLPPPAPIAEEKEPEPDTLLEGGGMGYSTERANELWAYRLKQAQAVFEEKLAAVTADLEPIKGERQTREHIEKAFVRQGGILADARKHWPLFSNYEPQIRAELARPGNERMQLDQAYRNVVVNAERADRARIEADTRKKLTEEMNGHASAPRSFRPGLPQPDGRAEAGGDEIEAIIRNAARSLG